MRFLMILLCLSFACDESDPGPACSDVCENLLTICTDFTAGECLTICEDDLDRDARQCVLTARSCSTATSSCLSEGECGDRVMDRGEECDDGNTMGGDGCSAFCTLEGPGVDAAVDGCAPGEVVCDDGCASLMTDNLNCGECGLFCSLDESCVAGVCERDPALSFTLEWDVPGNLDLHVVRPDGEEIRYDRPMPPVGPGGLDGRLEADDMTMGPEVVRFDVATPGAYHICVNPRAISERTEWTMRVFREGSLERVVEREATESVATFTCTADNANLTYNVL